MSEFAEWPTFDLKISEGSGQFANSDIKSGIDAAGLHSPLLKPAARGARAPGLANN